MLSSLELFCEVLGQQLVEVHVTILRTGGKADTVWGKGKGVYCTEVTSDITELLVIDDAHHSDGEATLSRLCGGDLSGVLTSCEEDMEFLHVSIVKQGADGCGSARLNEFEYSDGYQCFRVNKFRHAISGASDEHGVVIGHSEREDLALVHIGLSDNLIVLPIVYNEATLISGHIHGLVQRTP